MDKEIFQKKKQHFGKSSSSKFAQIFQRESQGKYLKKKKKNSQDFTLSLALFPLL